MDSQRDLMLAGKLYMANDPELTASHSHAQKLLAHFNSIRPDHTGDLTRVLRELVDFLGEGAIVKPSLRCDYGTNISIGGRTFINYDCVLLDCNTITIGEEVQIAPGVHIYTATHPLDPAQRRAGLEAAHPVVIGDGVWLGGRSVVCPGVTIGQNTVVGAGSIVTKDLPANVLAVGSPCRVVRPL